jgi:hypothetical protein
MFLLYCQRPSFTPIQNNRKNYSFVYSNLAPGPTPKVGYIMATKYGTITCFTKLDLTDSQPLVQAANSPPVVYYSC